MSGNRISDIIALMHQMVKPHWWICHYADNKHIAESPKKENLDLDEATALLRDAVKHLPSGRYKVQISDYPKGHNGRGDVSHLWFAKEEFDGSTSAQVQGFSYDMIGQIKADMEKQFEERIKAQEERWKHEQEMISLRKEIKELKEAPNTGIMGFFNTEQGQQVIVGLAGLLAQYLTTKMGIAPEQPPVAQPEQRAHHVNGTYQPV